MTVDFPIETYPTMLPHHFEAPPVPPLTQGLYAATDWQATGRFFNGVEVKGPNYNAGEASGIWDQPWCSVPPLFDADADPGDPGSERKIGVRPDPLPPFDAYTVWAYDQCDARQPTRREVESRVAQILKLDEQALVERAFATRMLEDTGTPEDFATLKEAVGYLEGEAAKVNTPAWFHIGAQWAAREFGLFLRAGTRWISPLGHTWVIGGGYVEGLVSSIVATSQPFGWRNEPEIKAAIAERHNVYAAIAERTVAIGYESVIAAAQVAP